jgi:tripartite-type tricarboxylate transporter receptor subunit TctC
MNETSSSAALAAGARAATVLGRDGYSSRASQLVKRGDCRDDERQWNKKPGGRPVLALRHALCALALIGVAASAAGRVEAQTYPDRLIKMVVPYPAGGPIDITARLVVQRLGPILGQTVIIENRGGAGGALGTKAVAAAEPDGYTLLFGNASALVVGPAVYRFRDYDTIKQFTPVAKVTEGYEVLVVAPDFPAKNVQELVAYAKANPGKLNFGSMGYGNLTHLAGELFKLQTGTDFTHVPYKGSPEAVAGIVTGQVHILFGEVAGLLPLVREGKIRGLGVASVGRNALAPELPTMIEGGLPDFVALTFTGVVAPAGTPARIVDKLNAAINESLKPPEVVAALGKLGAEVRTGSASEFGAFLAKERDKWVDVVTRTGIKAE